MITTPDGVVLVPGRHGESCPANGSTDPAARYCGKCEYVLCCTSLRTDEMCDNCRHNMDCPNAYAENESEDWENIQEVID